MRSSGLVRRLISAAAAAALLGTFLSGPANAAGPTVKIGVDLPMSGGDASNGIPTNNGVILAVEQANAKGLPGGIQLQVYTLDDAVQGTHDPAAGAQNLKTFVSDAAVLGVVGPFNSNVAKAEIPISNDAGLVQISPSNTNDGLTIGEDAKKLRTSHPDVNSYFRVCTRDQNQGKVGAELAKQIGAKKVYIVDDNETYGKGLADVFEAAFKAGGGTVLGHDHLTKNQQDFKALLTRIKATNPDAIYFGGVTVSGGGLLRRQMSDTGMGSMPFIGGDGISDEEFVKVAGSMANGSYYTVAAPDVEKLPSAKSFIEAYKAKFKSDPGPYSANAYAAAQVIINAISEAAKANGGKVPTRAEVLKNVQATKNLQTPIGAMAFDKNGDTTNGALSFYKIVNGKAQFTNQITLKT